MITVDDNLRTGEIPWGLSLERDAIGQRLLVALEQHAEGAPWDHKYDRNHYWRPDTQGSYEDPAYVGVYKRLFNVINPANYHYADGGNNYRQGYMWLCRDGTTQRLFKEADKWWQYDPVSKKEVFHEKTPKEGHSA